MSESSRRWFATALTLAIVVGVWVFIEWKARPPQPPAIKAFPWENEAPAAQR